MTGPLEEKITTATPAIPAEGTSSPSTAKPKQGANGLLLIGLFKLGKALFFLAVGIGALHLVHSDLGTVLLRATNFFHMDPDWRFVEMLQDKADLVSGHKLRQVGLLTFGYSALSLVEGTGLMLQKTWAEYLTLTLTIGALPWDTFELLRNPTWVRGSVVLINLAVLAYLIWFMRSHRRQMRESTAETLPE